jgi:hypothetical protein
MSNDTQVKAIKKRLNLKRAYDETRLHNRAPFKRLYEVMLSHKVYIAL